MLEHRDGDGLVLQEVKKTGGHAQLIDAVDRSSTEPTQLVELLNLTTTNNRQKQPPITKTYKQQATTNNQRKNNHKHQGLHQPTTTDNTQQPTITINHQVWRNYRKQQQPTITKTYQQQHQQQTITNNIGGSVAQW